MFEVSREARARFGARLAGLQCRVMLLAAGLETRPRAASGQPRGLLAWTQVQFAAAPLAGFFGGVSSTGALRRSSCPLLQVYK